MGTVPVFISGIPGSQETRTPAAPYQQKSIIAGISPVSSMETDLSSLKNEIGELYANLDTKDCLIMNVAGYPHRNMEISRFFVEESRKQLAHL